MATNSTPAPKKVMRLILWVTWMLGYSNSENVWHHVSRIGTLMRETSSVNIFEITKSVPVTLTYEIPTVENFDRLKACKNDTDSALIQKAIVDFNALLKDRISNFIEIEIPESLKSSENNDVLKASDFDCNSSHECAYRPTLFDSPTNSKHLEMKVCSKLGEACEGHRFSTCCSAILSLNEGVRTCPKSIKEFPSMKQTVINHFRYRGVPLRSICMTPVEVTNSATNSKFEINQMATNNVSRYLPLKSRSKRETDDGNKFTTQAYGITRNVIDSLYGILAAFWDATVGPTNQEVRPGLSRNKRSLLTYWAQGGPLAPYYIDSQIKTEKELESSGIDELKKELENDLKLTVRAEASKFESIESELCRLKSALSYDDVMSSLLERQNNLEMNLETSLQRCTEGRIPYSIPHKQIIKLCQVISASPQNCESESLIARYQCVLGLPTFRNNSIEINLRLTYKSINNEQSLRVFDILQSPVPITHQLLASADTHLKLNSEKPSSNITELLVQLTNLSKTRSRRDLERSYKFLKIALPDFIILKNDNFDSLNAFNKQDCVKVNGRWQCNIANADYKLSKCLIHIMKNGDPQHCDVSIVDKPEPCWVTYFEYQGSPNYLVSSHEKISIAHQNRQWFESRSHYLDCHSTCIFPSENYTSFQCGQNFFEIAEINKDVPIEIHSLTNWTGFPLGKLNVQSDFKTGISSIDEMILLSNSDMKDKLSKTARTLPIIMSCILVPLILMIILVLTVKYLKRQIVKLKKCLFCRYGHYSPREEERTQLLTPNDSTKMLNL